MQIDKDAWLFPLMDGMVAMVYKKQKGGDWIWLLHVEVYYWEEVSWFLKRSPCQWCVKHKGVLFKAAAFASLHILKNIPQAYFFRLYKSVQLDMRKWFLKFLPLKLVLWIWKAKPVNKNCHLLVSNFGWDMLKWTNDEAWWYSIACYGWCGGRSGLALL